MRIPVDVESKRPIGVQFPLIVLSTLFVFAPLQAQDSQPSESDTTETPSETVDQQGTPEPPPPEPPPKKAPPPEFDSPWSVVDTFVRAMDDTATARDTGDSEMEDEARDKATSCLDLSKVNSERAWLLAGRLVLILNRLDDRQPPRFLWQKHEIDEIYSEESEQVYFPHWFFDDVILSEEGIEPNGRIVISKQGNGSWLFSSDTVAGLDDLYLSLERLPVIGEIDEAVLGATDLWLKQFMPVTLKGKTLLTMEYWQWVALFIFIFVGLILDYTFRFFVRSMVTRIIRRQGGEPED